ncbi:M1 family metallopeptidase [Zhouia amylolytica]|uniref:Aminopeptidase N n=1 Tax=Zhouia amylolytica AD3 TaxID=1286632 RepID=W2UQ20_9FLAO|nr:M1 family metallopeptidase [Zhouia amylolytica]ETN95596.1 peptidase m1 membrane alanine aminopeptidase [Zhouia amylolytica AD3]
MNKTLLFICFIIYNAVFSKATSNAGVDILKGKASIKINSEQKSVSGTVVYNFHVMAKTDSLTVDARHMNFSEILLHNAKVRYRYTGDKLIIYKKFRSGKNYDLTISFNTTPSKAMYFIGWDEPNRNKELWTQGQGKYTSHWLPSFDDMNEKVEFDLSVTFNKAYVVIANGDLKSVNVSGESKTWNYDMSAPMSSYLLALAIGDFDKKVIYSEGGVPIELYYRPKDEVKLEPTYKYTKQIFDFLEKEIGVAYPWQNYKQVPVRDFMYAGMENTTLTIFSDRYVVDTIAYNDENYVNVNAHELAHQWFGDLVTEVDGGHHWLHEGFATYYALLAEREIFGDDYYFNALYESAKQLTDLSKQGKGEGLLDPEASSLTFYQKGAWALHVLRSQIGSHAFREGIKNYLNRYAYKNVTVDDFIREMEASSGKDLNEFKQTWLMNKEFPKSEAFNHLKRNKSLRDLIGLKDRRDTLLSEKERYDLLDSILEGNYYYTLKQEAVVQLKKLPLSVAMPLYKKAFKLKDLKVRQVLSMTLDSIPPDLQSDYESLLSDQSYTTMENALFNLWRNFPNRTSIYLDKTDGIYGFNNKNIRMLWLTLAILTEDYNTVEKSSYFDELSVYTSSRFNFEVRQNAFIMLNELQAFTDQNLKDLVNACLHHSWQFAKFSKSLLTDLLNDLTYKIRFESIISELNTKEQTFLKSKLQ